MARMARKAKCTPPHNLLRHHPLQSKSKEKVLVEEARKRIVFLEVVNTLDERKIKKLEEEVGELRERVRAYGDECAKMDDLRDRVRVSEEECEKWRTFCDKSRSRESKAQSRAKRISSKLTETDRKLKQTVALVEEMKGNMAKEREEYKNDKRRWNKLKDDYEKKLKKKKPPKPKISPEVALEIEKLQHQTQTLLVRKDEKLSQARAQIRHLQASLTALKSMCESQSGQYSQLRSQIRRGKAQIDEKERQIIQYKLKIQTERKVAEEVSKKITQVMGERDSLRRALSKQSERDSRITEKMADQLEKLEKRRVDEEARLKFQHKAELDIIHTKIRKVIESKDSQIHKLSEVVDKLKLKIVKLEKYMLQQKNNI
ncbi:hypothetical protein AAMO2058_000837400 [Amorphochlora amoebiformis]